MAKQACFCFQFLFIAKKVDEDLGVADDDDDEILGG